METPVHLVPQGRQQPLLLQQLLDDAVAEAEACAGLGLAPQRGQQPVVAAAPEDRPQLAPPVPALKHDPCAECQLGSQVHGEMGRYRISAERAEGTKYGSLPSNTIPAQSVSLLE